MINDLRFVLIVQRKSLIIQQKTPKCHLRRAS